MLVAAVGHGARSLNSSECRGRDFRAKLQRASSESEHPLNKGSEGKEQQMCGLTPQWNSDGWRCHHQMTRQN